MYQKVVQSGDSLLQSQQQRCLQVHSHGALGPPTLIMTDSLFTYPAA